MEETLGKRIVKHRKSLHLTQDQLAEKLGVTAQAVSKWENDQSCPDINMLPRLARLFGTTTDALLGQETIYDTEVVTEENSRPRENFEFHWDNNRRGAMVFALYVLLVGGLLMASRLLNWGVGIWSIAWPSALAVFGISALLKRFRVFPLAVALVGCYYLATNLGLMAWRMDSSLIFPALVLLVGVSLLIDALGKKKKHVVHVAGRDEKKFASTFTQDEDSFEAKVSFGTEKRTATVPYLKNGRVACSFGEMTVDLTACEQIVDGCVLDLECSFGELILIVPENCIVRGDNKTSFGDMTIVGAPNEDASITLHLRGKVSFGDITVRYQ